MTELISVAEKVSQISLPVLLLLVLYGGAKKWWTFGYQLTECETRNAALLTAAEKRESEWKELALSGAIIARNAVEKLKGGAV